MQQAHIHFNLLEQFASTIHASPEPICFYSKVKAHSGIAINECADAIAKHSALHDGGQDVHSKPPAPNGSAYTHLYWFVVIDTDENFESWGSSVALRCFSRTWSVHWWRWACPKRGARSFILPRPSGFVSWGKISPCVYTLIEDSQQFAPTCCNRSTADLFTISLLCRTLHLFTLLLNLWICGRPRPVSSQQPISQTTWLKVTPHCNHCNHLHRWGAQRKKKGSYT